MPTEKIFDGKSLLDEMDYMFRSITTHTQQNPPQSPDFDHATTNKRNEITELASRLQRKNSSDPCSSNSGSSKSKKNKNTGTIKQISHKDEKILNQAIEIANEMCARSMTDLFTNENANNQSSTHSPKRKLSFKFPLLSSGSGNASDKDGGGSVGGGGGGSSASGVNSSNSSTLTHSKERKNFSEELRNVSDLQVCFFFDLNFFL